MDPHTCPVCRHPHCYECLSQWCTTQTNKCPQCKSRVKEIKAEGKPTITFDEDLERNTAQDLPSPDAPAAFDIAEELEDEEEEEEFLSDDDDDEEWEGESDSE